MQNWDDSQLLTAISGGNRQAMQVLYERHHNALLAFIRSRGSDGDLAADVLHDTMLDVWRHADRFRGSASARTWMFSIARNKYVDRVRKSARLTLVDEVPETADDSPDAVAVLEASQDADRVRICLEKLKEVQRAVIRLAFFEDLNYDQIAEIEGVALGTVKSRVFHAKKLLMGCLSV